MRRRPVVPSSAWEVTPSRFPSSTTPRSERSAPAVESEVDGSDRGKFVFFFLVGGSFFAVGAMRLNVALQLMKLMLFRQRDRDFKRFRP